MSLLAALVLVLALMGCASEYMETGDNPGVPETGYEPGVLDSGYRGLETEDETRDQGVCGVCACSEEGARVDCSNRRLSDLPEGVTDEITHLNLANNEFTSIPDLQHLYMLQILDFSNNQLSSLSSDALRNLTQLEVLNLANNAFISWTDLNPNVVLLPAEKLRELDLTNNALQKLANLTHEDLLVSASVVTLILEDCGLVGIQGQSFVSGLTNIKSLRLRGNPIRKLEKLYSPTLQHLDVSHCSLGYVSHYELSYLPALIRLQISNNYRLLITTRLGNLSSDSLRELDIAYCSIDHIALTGFPSLRRVNMSSNSVAVIAANDFYNNTKLDILDLSYNSIASFHPMSFRGLISLKHLNLTGNKLRDIDGNIFMRSTVTLISLRLSRNYFTKLSPLQSGTLQVLDFSMCEIDRIDKDALEGLWSLKCLDLSRNLLGSIPNSFSSDTLTSLDLSNNRLSTINNFTFHMIPRLQTLSVASNRFSTIWSRSFFDSNRYLEKVDLNDNTWRCECADAGMFDFFEFLTLEPSKLEESSDLICSSPANVSGVTWQKACEATWYPTTRVSGYGVSATFFTCLAIFFACCGFVVITIRRLMAVKQEEARLERERQAEEARERLRRIRMQHEQQAQCNAPDPRDLVSPPSYAEALLMPRPLSVHSLNISTGDAKRKKSRRRAKSSGDVRSGDSDVETERPQTRTRRTKRFGSHELKELNRSPRAPRRHLSADEIDGNADISVHIETDSESESTTRLMSQNRNEIQVVNVRECDF